MFSSLRSRLWLSYALLIAAALGVVAIVQGLYLLRNPLLYRQTLDRLRLVENAIVNRQLDLAGESLPVGLDRVARAFDVRVVLFDQNGNVIKDTQPDQPAIGLPGRTLFPRNVPTLRDASGKAWLYSLYQLGDGRTLLVTSPRPRVALLTLLRDELMPIFFQGGGIALLLSLILAFAIARWVADPLQHIVLASQQFPSEARKLDERGPREVRELTRSFNAMLARVQSTQKSQRDFVANVSHELKTPLTSIQGFAQAILDGTADTLESQKQAASVIYSESGRMYRMVLDLLDLARLDAGTADLKMSPVDVPLLLDSILEKFMPQARRAEVALISEIEPDLPALVADGDRLAQVFTNLVDNAIKHTPVGGQVTVRVGAIGDEMIFQVTDTGQGIPPEALPHIFDRFYQADLSRSGGKKHGAGLGLAIVHEIVAAHGGRIDVRSQLGQGTIFVIHLPLVQPSASTIVRRKK